MKCSKCFNYGVVACTECDGGGMVMGCFCDACEDGTAPCGCGIKGSSKDFLAEYDAISNLFMRYSMVASQYHQSLSDLPGCTYDNIVALCNEGYGNKFRYPTDKLYRWLGFVQGVLASQGLISVQDERDYTRPIFHALYDGKMPSF